jgi:hypothetical protein
MLQATLDFAATAPAPQLRGVAPLRELGAHEALWLRPGMTAHRLAELFRRAPGAVPSDLVDPALAATTGAAVLVRLRQRGIARFGVRIHRTADYPLRLRDVADVIIEAGQSSGTLIQARAALAQRRLPVRE